MIEEILMPKNVKAVFPNDCNICNQPINDQYARLDYKSNGIREFLERLFREKVDSMAHEECFRKSRRINLLTKMVVFSIAFTIFFIGAFTQITGISLPFVLSETYILVAVVIIGLSVFILEEINPRALLIKEQEDCVKYQFRNKDYAEKFRKLNFTQLKKTNSAEVEEIKESLDQISQRIKAIACLYENNYEEAISILTNIIDQKPKASENYALRGEAFLRQKRFEKALRDFNKSLEIAPNDSETLRLRAIAYRKIRRFEESRNDRFKAREIESSL